MTRLIASALPVVSRSPPLASSPPTAPLVIMSDVDEIPAAHTIRLIKACAFPRVVHLQLRNYVYSFEWPSGWGSWRAQVHEWRLERVFTGTQKRARLPLLMLVGIVGEFGCVLRTCLVGY